MAVEIPLVDFTNFVGGTAEGRRKTAARVYSACHEVGFMYVRGLGIPPELITRTFAQAKAFFELPPEAKNSVAWDGEVSNRGYVGIERERLDAAKPGDLKEAFNIGNDVPLAALEAADRALVQNQWPQGEEYFRETNLEFFQACGRAANALCEAFAIALQLPEKFFVGHHDKQDYTLRLLHYPPIASAPKENQIRAGEHSDYGSMTLLFQDDAGGLEVRRADGKWIEATPVADAIVVNTGDLMQRWTNHIFTSTVHRVRVPTDERQQRSRYSIAFFCQPNFDSEIACLETCQGPERPPLHPPVLSGEYLLSRLQATY